MGFVREAIFIFSEFFPLFFHWNSAIVHKTDWDKLGRGDDAYQPLVETLFSLMSSYMGFAPSQSTLISTDSLTADSSPLPKALLVYLHFPHEETYVQGTRLVNGTRATWWQQAFWLQSVFFQISKGKCTHYYY